LPETTQVPSGLYLGGEWRGGQKSEKGTFYGSLDVGGLAPEDVSTTETDVGARLAGMQAGTRCYLRVAPRVWQGKVSWTALGVVVAE